MKSILAKLLIKYRVDVFKKESLEKISSFHLNKMQLSILFIFIFALSFFVSSVFIFFTPIGDKFFEMSKKSEISKLYMQVDSIENLLNLQLDYSERLKLIFNDFDTTQNQSNSDVAFSLNSLQSKMTQQDSTLLSFIKKLDNESVYKYNQSVLQKLNLQNPTNGMITSKFDAKNKHFGVDIAAKENSDVYSVLSGVIVFSGFSDELGNFIIVAHENNFFSVYLHNSSLLKNKGDVVNSGDKIALVGSTGKLSSAPHLHFELWSGLNPIDPEKYLQFD